MLRTVIALLLILVGIVSIAGGIWGFSLQIDNDVNPDVLSAAQTVLGWADGAMETADGWLSDLTGGKYTVTGVLNDVTGNSVNLTNDHSVAFFALMNAMELLLGGIIGVETGLLLFKFGRR